MESHHASDSKGGRGPNHSSSSSSSSAPVYKDRGAQAHAGRGHSHSHSNSYAATGAFRRGASHAMGPREWERESRGRPRSSSRDSAKDRRVGPTGSRSALGAAGNAALRLRAGTKRKISGMAIARCPDRRVIVSNHPTGIADGIVVWRALAARRPDLFIFANADALRVLPRLADVLAPV